MESPPAASSAVPPTAGSGDIPQKQKDVVVTDNTDANNAATVDSNVTDNDAVAMSSGVSEGADSSPHAAMLHEDQSMTTVTNNTTTTTPRASSSPQNKDGEASKISDIATDTAPQQKYNDDSTTAAAGTNMTADGTSNPTTSTSGTSATTPTKTTTTTTTSSSSSEKGKQSAVSSDATSKTEGQQDDGEEEDASQPFGFGDIEQLLANNDLTMSTQMRSSHSDDDDRHDSHDHPGGSGGGHHSQGKEGAGGGKGVGVGAVVGGAPADPLSAAGLEDIHGLGVSTDPVISSVDIEEVRVRAFDRQAYLERKLEGTLRRVCKHELAHTVRSIRRNLVGASHNSNSMGASANQTDANVAAQARDVSHALRGLRMDSKRPRTTRRGAGKLYRHIRHISTYSDPEATESSSACSSDSEDDEIPNFLTPDYVVRGKAPEVKLHQVQVEWDANRAEIGWRWNWLQLRLATLDAQIEEHNSLVAQSRAKRSAWHFEEGECARSRGLAPGQKRRRLISRHNVLPNQDPVKVYNPSMQHSNRNAIRTRSAMLDRSFHLVLSLLTDAPAFVLDKAREHRNRWISAFRRHPPSRHAQFMRVNRAIAQSPQKLPLHHTASVGGMPLHGAQGTPVMKGVAGTSNFSDSVAGTALGPSGGRGSSKGGAKSHKSGPGKAVPRVSASAKAALNAAKAGGVSSTLSKVPSGMKGSYTTVTPVVGGSTSSSSALANQKQTSTSATSSKKSTSTSNTK